VTRVRDKAALRETAKINPIRLHPDVTSTHKPTNTCALTDNECVVASDCAVIGDSIGVY
jgi:hypothetical protein